MVSSARRAWRVPAAAVTALAVGLTLALAGPAHAAPDITLTEDAPETVLFGTTAPVTLTASNPAGQPEGYNLSFRYVLPPGTSYQPGSAPTAPRILTDAPTPGRTTLLFDNLADLPPGTSHSLRFEIAHDTGGAFEIGDTYTTESGAYVNEDPRWVADFDPTTGEPVPGPQSFTGSATSSGTTRITAIEIEKDEPSPEGEILRGVHDQRTHYTLTVRNNSVNPTQDIVVDDYLPAALEFLACGDVDNSTTVTEEYTGSGPLGAAPYAGGGFDPADCLTPDRIESVTLDPDGPGPLPSGVYTHVRWTIPVALAPAGTFDIQYVAGIAARENEMPPLGGMGWPTPESLEQGANLDNNTGPETTDEQVILNGARAGGLYNGVLAVEDETTLTRTAEDVRLLKSVAPGTLAHDTTSTWTLDVDVSEYRSTGAITVSDVVPDGLCPLDAGTDYETPPSGDCAGNPGDAPSHPFDPLPSEQTDGTWTLGWVLAALPRNGSQTITYRTKTRTDYQENGTAEAPVASFDTATNAASLTTQTTIHGDAPTDQPVRTAIDASEATIEGDGPSIAKEIQDSTAGRLDCTVGGWGTSPGGAFHPGDRVCYRLTVEFPRRSTPSRPSSPTSSRRTRRTSRGPTRPSPATRSAPPRRR